MHACVRTLHLWCTQVMWNGDEAGGISINGTEYALKQLHWHSPSEHSINRRRCVIPSRGSMASQLPLTFLKHVLHNEKLRLKEPLAPPSTLFGLNPNAASAALHACRFSLEMHMVHQSADNKTAVVGILYKAGLPDPFIRQVIYHNISYGGDCAQLERSIKKVKDKKDKEEELGAVDPSLASRRMGQRYYRYMGSLTTPPCSEGVIWTILRKVGHTYMRSLCCGCWHLTDYENNARPRQMINGRLIGFYRPPKHEN
ncbi:hypothetical protein GW17_00013423 [Ensete ventricosum]|nr:hypothetical protein GW17_00013423 [Ensete ventricosum]